MRHLPTLSFIGLIGFFASNVFAIDVRVVNSTNNPVNVTGSISVSSHVIVDNLPGTFTVTPGTGTFTVNTSTHVTVDNFPTTYNVSGSTINIQGTVPVSGTFFPAIQPVSFTTPYPVFVATTSVSIDGSSNTVKITGTPTVTFAATGVNASTTSVVPLRPTQGYGRVYKEATANNLTTSTTIYTVTSGKTLYVTSIIASGQNSNTTSSGLLQIKDSNTIKVPISIPTAGVGALASLVQSNFSGITFQEPVPFTVGFNITVASGTITYSLMFNGYEE